MNICDKCSKISGILLAILGILFLLQDLGVWGFWGINWYTAIFLLMGISMLGMSCCDDCGKANKK